MITLTERTIMKSRSGVYSDTAENRRKHRVGQKYGAEKQPEDGEKTEKKEDDPAKELEAVNKVIAAINEGKLNLPAAEVTTLLEKKQKLEAAKKQAEKINAGVKANEEKRNAKEIKETNKKINEASKQKKYGDISVDFNKEDLKSLDDKSLNELKDKLREKYNEEDKLERRAFERHGYFTANPKSAKYDDRLRAVENEIKKRAESKNEPEKNEKSETEKETDKETYTRVKFDDIPNSGKVNLKKYLSEKVRQGVDEKWSNIKNIPTDNLKKMEKGLVNDLNKNFEAIKKSQRAELLYSIMKVKGELEKRGKESQKKE